MMLGNNYVNHPFSSFVSSLCGYWMSYNQKYLLNSEIGYSTCSINACANSRALEEGRHVHEHINQHSLESDVIVGSRLVDMYAQCGSTEGENVMQVVGLWWFWTHTLWQGQEGFLLSQHQQHTEEEPLPVTVVELLNACTSLRAFQKGMLPHEEYHPNLPKKEHIIPSKVVNIPGSL
jgi:hypothetical protein